MQGEFGRKLHAASGTTYYFFSSPSWPECTSVQSRPPSFFSRGSPASAGQKFATLAFFAHRTIFMAFPRPSSCSRPAANAALFPVIRHFLLLRRRVAGRRSRGDHFLSSDHQFLLGVHYPRRHARWQRSGTSWQGLAGAGGSPSLPVPGTDVDGRIE